MGLIGVFWARYLTNTMLSTTWFMGILNELPRRGMDLQTAVPRAGRRPPSS